MIRRAGKPSDTDATLAVARRRFGMTTLESPLAFYLDPRRPAPEPGAPPVGGPSLEALMADERPSATTHFTEGALAERAARHAHGALPDSG